MNKDTLLGIIPRRFIKILLENRQFTNISAKTWANMTTDVGRSNQIKQTIFLSGQEQRSVFATNTPQIDEDPEEWRLADRERRRDRSISDQGNTSEYDNTS